MAKSKMIFRGSKALQQSAKAINNSRFFLKLIPYCPFLKLLKYDFARFCIKLCNFSGGGPIPNVANLWAENFARNFCIRAISQSLQFAVENRKFCSHFSRIFPFYGITNGAHLGALINAPLPYMNRGPRHQRLLYT